MRLAQIARRMLAGAGVLTLTVGTAIAQQAAPANRPNILVIMADDLGYSDLGAYGGEIRTPNLDALARSGLMFTNFYTAASCAPTRAMLLTGVDNNTAGIAIHHENRPMRFNNDVARMPAYEGFLGLQTATIAEILQDAGYHTVMAAKWHMGWQDGFWPDDRGFDASFGLQEGGAAHFKQANMAGNQGWTTTFIRNGEVIDNASLPDDYYSSTYFAQFVMDNIANRGNEPFFAWLGFTAPHWPLQAPAEYINMYRGRYDAGYEVIQQERLDRQRELGLAQIDSPMMASFKQVPAWSTLTPEQQALSARDMEVYAAMVTAMDHEVGRVLQYLRDTGQYDNTIILFLSDNGAEGANRNGSAAWQAMFDNSLANRGLANSFIGYGAGWAQVGTAPNVDHKLTGFDGGNNVPFFIAYPGIQPGLTDAVGHATDIVPTLLEMAGVPHPGTQFRGRTVVPVEGISLVPLLRREVTDVRPDDYVLGFQILQNASIHYGDWRLVWSGQRSMNQWQLFNVGTPEGQRSNLASSNPEMHAHMLGLWREYAAEHGIATNPTTFAPINPPLAPAPTP